MTGLKMVSAFMVILLRLQHMGMYKNGTLQKPTKLIKTHFKFCTSALCLIAIRVIKEFKQHDMEARSWTLEPNLMINGERGLRTRLVNIMRKFVPFAEVLERHERDEPLLEAFNTAEKMVDQCDALGEWYRKTDERMKSTKGFAYLTGDVGMLEVKLPNVEARSFVLYDHHVMFGALKPLEDGTDTEDEEYGL
jgi:hypothetical protein